MKRYKALLLDLDGTTVASRADGLPSKATEQAIKEVLPIIKVAVATGRSWHLAKPIIRQLGLTEPCILDGGSQIILPATGQILFHRTLSVAKQREIIALCLPLHCTIIMSIHNQTTIIKRVEDAMQPVGKIELEHVPLHDVNQVLAKLSAIKDVVTHIASSWQPGDFVAIHITDVQATKAHAVIELLNIMGVAPTDTIGVGDNLNDLPLFDVVGLKVAMGNSPNSLKEVADYIAPDLVHDGVADVIERFIMDSF